MLSYARKWHIWLAFAVFFATNPIWSQPSDTLLHPSAAPTTKRHVPWNITISVDQDYFLKYAGLENLNSDRNYTMGAGLTLGRGNLDKSFIMKPLQLVNSIMAPRLSDLRRYSSYSQVGYANGSFTPDSIEAVGIISNDRPYGSVNIIQTIMVCSNLNKPIMHTTTFSVGFLGLGISESFQSWVHQKWFKGKRPKPAGWGHQISSGGEFTALYTHNKTMLLAQWVKNLYPDNPKPGLGFSLYQSYGYKLGYYTGLNYEIGLRFGWIDPNFWGSSDLLGNVNKFKPQIPALRSGIRKSECYFFGYLRPNYVHYNALLNGQFSKSDFAINFLDTRHYVTECRVGMVLGLNIKDKYYTELRLHVDARSPEFELQGRKPRSHYWAGLDLSFWVF